MIEVGFECSIIFFRIEVAACMWQKAPAEEATRQKRKTTVNNIFLYFLIEETNHLQGYTNGIRRSILCR
jgi:hypothetical protein